MMLFRTACLVAALCAGANAVNSAGRFDGTWEVEGSTDVGTCPASFQGHITVRDDDIVGSDAQTALATGVIETNGVAWGHFQRGAEIVRAQGTFAASAASGAWSSSTSLCGGRWHARRQSLGQRTE